MIWKRGSARATRRQSAYDTAAFSVYTSEWLIAEHTFLTCRRV
jgi:hypothetical protein